MNAARISRVNDLVTHNSRKNPYLLFPLRLETHFREAAVPDYPQHETEILGIFKLFKSALDTVRLANNPTRSQSDSEQLASLPKKLYDLEQQILQIDVISAEDKDTIVNLARTFTLSIQRSIPPVVTSRILPYCRKVGEAAYGIVTSNVLKENRASRFMARLEACDTSLKTLSDIRHSTYIGLRRYQNSRNMSFRNKAQNERLYQYITGRLIRTITFFEEAITEFDEIPSLDTFQRQKIYTLMGCPTRSIRQKIGKPGRFQGEYDYSPFRKKLDAISANLDQVYKSDSFRKSELMKRYKNIWASRIASARKAFNAFEQHFLKQIVRKPARSSHYTRLVNSLFQLNMTLYTSRSRYPGLKAQELTAAIAKLNKLASFTRFGVNEEADFCRVLADDLAVQLKAFIQAQHDKGYADYLDEKRNQQLVASLFVQLIYPNRTIGKVNQRQLCVRIFPDDIFINRFDEQLTRQEVLDGKKFWMQWYIASGNKVREYEAWKTLCAKYRVLRASWIVRKLRPPQLKGYIGETLIQGTGDTIAYDHRPYLQCTHLEVLLNEFVLSISDLPVSVHEKKETNEQKIREGIRDLSFQLYEIRNLLMGYEKIVDYIYQHAYDTLMYVDRRLDAIHEFYGTHPEYKVHKPMEYWDMDYFPLTNFQREVRDLIQTMEPRLITMDNLIDDFLQRIETEPIPFFPPITSYRDPEQFAVPTSPILPDRFLFFGDTTVTNAMGRIHAKRIVFAGRKVKKDLPMGFDPNEDQAIDPYAHNLATGDLEVRGGIRWMTDYTAAEGAGMAITVPLPHSAAEYKNVRFSSVYVLGIKDCPDNTEKAIIQRLFDGHIYGGTGMDLLKVGTPTNSFDEVVSGFNSDDSLIEVRRYEIEVEEIFKGVTNDASRLAEYLGINYEQTTGRISHFDQQEIQLAMDVNRLMWKVIKPKEMYHMDKVNDFMTHITQFLSEYCAGRGILPSLRIGNQPYGILPTSAFSCFELDPSASFLSTGTNKRKWTPMFTFCVWLAEILRRLSVVWKQFGDEKVICSENLVNTATGDKNSQVNEAQERYMEMMGLTPTSVEFFERLMLHAAPLLFNELNYKEANEGWKLHKLMSDLFYLYDSSGPDGREKGMEKLPFFNYHPIGNSVNQRGTDALPLDLAAMFKHLRNQLTTEQERKRWDELTRPLTVKEEIVNRNILFAEFLDLFTHRLDAWWLGLVNYQRKRSCSDQVRIGAFGWLMNLERKKEENRKVIPAGTERTKVCNDMQLSGDRPIYKDANFNEFILAPSISHAITAAVLKSSYDNSKRTGVESNLCINLSSARVRQAIRLIDGMRSGLSVGAILGADMERNLHEAYKVNPTLEMDRYIYPLRELFPLKIEIDSEQQDESAKAYHMTVINAELLINNVKAGWNGASTLFSYLQDTAAHPAHLSWLKGMPLSAEHRTYLIRLIEQMADAFDALGDVVLSEGVYQLVEGNRVAFSALMGNLEKGVNLPYPKVTELPLHSAYVRHKVAIALKPCEQDPEGWTPLRQTPSVMDKTEPALNQWVGQALGDAALIRFAITLTGRDGTVRETDCSLRDLDISPLDYLYLSSDPEMFVKFLELAYRLDNNRLEESVCIHPRKRLPAWDMDCHTLFENEYLLKDLRNLVLQGSALKVTDFLPEGSEGYAGGNKYRIDYADLFTRVDKLKNTLAYLKSGLLGSELYEYLQNTTLTLKEAHRSDRTMVQLMEFLKTCCLFGFREVIAAFSPELFIRLTGNGADDEERRARSIRNQDTLLNTLRQTYRQITEKLDKVNELTARFNQPGYVPADGDEDRCVEAIQCIFNESFRVLPVFTIPDDQPGTGRDDLTVQLDAGFRYANLTPLQLENWLMEAGGVREQVQQLQSVRQLMDINGIPQGVLSVIQLPFDREKDKEWLGREVSSEELLEDKECMVLLEKDRLTVGSQGRNVGMVFDRWMELIPYKNQDGGVVFNFDQPNAEAPQTLLMAVSPRIRERYRQQVPRIRNWSLNELILTLSDTLEMAKMRAVEPDHLYGNAHTSKLFPLLRYGFENYQYNQQ